MYLSETKAVANVARTTRPAVAASSTPLCHSLAQRPKCLDQAVHCDSKSTIQKAAKTLLSSAKRIKKMNITSITQAAFSRLFIISHAPVKRSKTKPGLHPVKCPIATF